MRLSPTRAFVAEAGCYWPFREDVQPPPEKENAAMRRGKMIHSAIEARVKRNDQSIDCPEADTAVDWARGRGRKLLSEQVFGIEPVHGAVRRYETKDDVPSYELPVIVDLIVGDSETWDFKSGSPFSTFSYEPQIRFTAYAVASWLKVDELISGLAYVSVEGVRAKDWTLDEFDFADQRRKLRVWSAAAPKAEPTPCSACKYCPARSVCPAMKEKVA